jgi:hypothetical protein
MLKVFRPSFEVVKGGRISSDGLLLLSESYKLKETLQWCEQGVTLIMKEIDLRGKALLKEIITTSLSLAVNRIINMTGG